MKITECFKKLERKYWHFYFGILAIIIAGLCFGLGRVTMLNTVSDCQNGCNTFNMSFVEANSPIWVGLAIGLLIVGIVLLKNYKRLDIYDKEKELFQKKNN
jgi:membrane protease YdiL (CAAX protease family)